MARLSFLPKQGFIGLLLISGGWYLAWQRPDGLQFIWENSFLLLWVGYSFFIDGLVYKIKGSSLFSRNRIAFLGMFLLSIPGWWLFEFFNIFLQNWHYVFNRPVGPVEYAIRSSIHFSIVTPAVLGTAELWASLSFFKSLTRRAPYTVTDRQAVNVILIGILMLIAVITLPQYSFPLVWICLILIMGPVNYIKGIPSVIHFVNHGNYRPIIVLALGALSCGFFWEMWNYYAMPKWIYTVPFVDFCHVFEMPVLGYLGYLPFGIEVFLLYHLLMDLLGKSTVLYGGENYIQL